MQHTLTPYSSPIESYVFWENGFTEQELNWLQNQAKNASQIAQVGGAYSMEELQKIRRSQVSWINKNQETSWIFEKLGHIVSSLNAKFYRFNLTGFGEPLQLTNYDQSDNGMYGWHVDYGGSAVANRKLSIVVQLSDPSEYDGGNLEVLTSGQPLTVKKQRGLVVAFPSYTLHQVTPVINGSRQTLVSWITGPAFQ